MDAARSGHDRHWHPRAWRYDDLTVRFGTYFFLQATPGRSGSDVIESEMQQMVASEVLVKAWTDERVTFSGQHWHFINMPVYPKPRTRPHPPLAVAAISPDSIGWTARHGYRLLSSGLGTPLPALARQRALYEEALLAAGHAQCVVEELLGLWTVTRHVYVADTDEQARAEAEPHERWYLDSFARSQSAD